MRYFRQTIGLTTLLCVAPLVTGAPVFAQDAPDVTSADIAFVNVNVVPMDRERVLESQTVIVEDGVITRLGPANEIEVSAGTLQIDGTDKYLMPGLVDSHVHTGNSEDHLRLYVANGITSVRNMAGFPLHLEWRQRVAVDPDFVSPMIYTAGPVIDGDPPIRPQVAVAATPEEGRSLVAEHAAAGYDFIKVYLRLRADTYDAIMEAAVAHGLTVQGHVPFSIGLFGVLASGQHAIEHLSGYLEPAYSEAFAVDRSSGLSAVWARRLEVAEGLASGELEWDEVFDPAAIERAAEATVAAGTWNIPTITVWQFVAPDEYEQRARAPGTQYVQYTIEAWNPSLNRNFGSLSSDQMRALRELIQGFGRRMLAALYEAGGNLLVGTDTPNPFVLPGFSIHEELAHFVQSGLSPYETLARATRIPAEFMGLADSVGTIAVHQRADLLLLDADPLADVANVRLLAGVSLRGTWLSADAIDAMLEEIEALAQERLLLHELEPLLLAGEISEALQAYQNAQERGASIPARAWNWLCWYGSLWGHAAEVMAACDQAVALVPDNGSARDSRGLARALTGDVAGAINDFAAYVAWTGNDRSRAQRQDWIVALRSGENPFTAELLERLRN